MNKGARAGEKRTLPGKKAKELLNLRNEYVPKGVFQVGPLFVCKAKGAMVEDVDGNEYIDFAGGIATLNVGHCNDRVVSAIKEQADRHLHTCFHVLMYESYIELAKKLCEITPGGFRKQALLINSGAEAVENAIKVARRYSGKQGVIVFENAFHGRTTLAMALTSQIKYYKFGFGPFVPYLHRVPYAYCYRCPHKLTYPGCGIHCLQRIEDSFVNYMAPEEIAAILVEPILGEGGYVIPPAEFLKGLRKICDERNIVFIADEVQSGIGRTGKMWAIEHFDIVPDVLLAAKSLGGGMVLSATIGRKEVMDSVDVGGVGGTFAGNPLSCIAALRTIETFEKDKLLDRATKLGNMAKDRLESMKKEYEIIGDVRGLGCVIGVELVKDRKTKAPATAETKAILKKCQERGLIIMSCGPLHNVCRFMFPLVITKEELIKGLDILDDVMREVNATI